MLLRPALIALQFLTSIPVRLSAAPCGREIGLSLLWYPCVGGLLGTALWATGLLLSGAAASLAAAIVLALWVVATGALHLDGLADTADGWIGGRGDRVRTLAIMKDPYTGPVGVAAVVCLLLLKFAALSALQAGAGMHASGRLGLACGYVLPPVLARAAVPLLFAHTCYVRESGIGAALSRYQSRTGAWWVAGLVGLLALLGCGPRKTLLASAAAAVPCLLMRQAFVRRLGGITGDCAGAMIEVVEVMSLIALIIID